MAAVTPTSETESSDSNMNNRKITVIQEEDSTTSATKTTVHSEKPKKKVRTVRMRYKSDEEEDADDRKERPTTFNDVITDFILPIPFSPYLSLAFSLAFLSYSLFRFLSSFLLFVPSELLTPEWSL